MESQGAEGGAQEKPEMMISNLPTEYGWSTSQDKSVLYKYQGFWYEPGFIDGILRAQELGPSELNISPDDVILCTSAKVGTTWLKALAFSIVTRSQYDPNSKEHPLLSSFPHNLIPFMEMRLKTGVVDVHRQYPLLATHMPYTALPKAVVSTYGCKIVYICRNLKDVLVLLWHFKQKMRYANDDLSKDTRPISLEKAFDLFCNGTSPFGPYWDHVLGYWKASLDHPDKVLFLKYEDMMEDGESHVKRLAEFMGYPFSDEEERQGIPARIVELCSFGSLSKVEVNKTGVYHLKGPTGQVSLSVNFSNFFRKAKVEDWKNYLTQEMADKLDEISLQKLGKFGLIL